MLKSTQRRMASFPNSVCFPLLTSTCLGCYQITKLLETVVRPTYARNIFLFTIKSVQFIPINNAPNLDSFLLHTAHADIFLLGISIPPPSEFDSVVSTVEERKQHVGVEPLCNGIQNAHNFLLSLPNLPLRYIRLQEKYFIKQHFCVDCFKFSFIGSR